MQLVFVVNRIDFAINLGIAYLSGVLQANGYNVLIFEIGDHPKKLIQKLRRLKPDIVAYSVISGGHHEYLTFNRALKKELKFCALVGGPHTTFYPETIEDDAVDAICVGEGEIALLEFVKKFKPDDLPEDVRNFWVKKNGRIIKNPVRPPVAELDALPLPDRKSFINQYPRINNYGIKQFMAHRGCPYACAYCFNKPYNTIYKGNKIYRARDPEKICEEINYTRTLTKIEVVRFVDDVFTLNKKWTLKFAQIYKKRVGLPFHMNTRFDNLDEEIVYHLKEANCDLVNAGVEAGDAFIRDKIMNRHMTLESIHNGARLLKKYGIKLLTENIIGVPGEDFDAALKTLQVNIDIQPDMSNCSFFTPYPKLELTDYAVKKGYFDGDVNKINSTYYYDILIDQKDKMLLRKKLNLRPFFSLLTKHPSLLPFFIKYVFPRPLTPLYRLLGEIIDGYYLRKCLPFKMSLAETAKNVFYYFASYRFQSGRESQESVPSAVLPNAPSQPIPEQKVQEELAQPALSN